MRVVLQRCTTASVSIDGEVVGEIGKGMLILLAIADSDSNTELQWMCNKLVGLRIFEDADGKMNHSLLEVGGEMLVVSQFTLYGNCRKGRRPSFVGAGHPDMAAPMVERFVEEIRRLGVTRVETGRFAADMQVSLVNDGPVTLIIDSPEAV